MRNEMGSEQKQEVKNESKENNIKRISIQKLK